MKNSTMNFFLLSLTVCCSAWSINVQAAELSTSAFRSDLQTAFVDNSALPADAAFTLSAFIELPDTIVLMWEIEEGYYLYKKSLSFSEAGKSLLQVAQVPDGISINDEFFGDVDVYYDKLQVRIPFKLEKSETLLHLSYQGCAVIGYCYPMQQKTVALELP